jgi:hypothetical protein
MDRLAELGRIEIPHLREARDYTSTESAAMKGRMSSETLPADISIVIFGSWAREELTEHSDHDFAVLVARPFEPYDDDVSRAMLKARQELGQGTKQPGSQDIFGVPFDLDAVVRYIGLEADTNTNLTRRMLLLLESTEIAGTAHTAAWARVLDRYLEAGTKAYRPPRFLLNDLVRYWRTILVDFEGKHAEGTGHPKWAVRNAKLRTSRKLLFAGGLIPLLLCHTLPEAHIRPFLHEWLSATPLDRMAAAFLHLDAIDEGARALRAYDRWIAIQQTPAARELLHDVREETRDRSAVFEDIRKIGESFEASLLALLFDTALGPVTRRYIVF